MSYSFGKLYSVTVFGQSHSDYIGGVIDGIPAGIELDMKKIESFLSRRAPGKNAFSTARKEADIPCVISGIVEGKTCGAPLTFQIKNGDTRSRDYDKLRVLPRPMHSDYPAYVKYHGANDIRGGGQFSGRLTAPLCFAGAAAMQILEKMNIYIGAHVYEIAGEKDIPFDSVSISKETLLSSAAQEYPVLDKEKLLNIQKKISEAAQSGDSVGGIIECAVLGLSAGIGEPLYDSLESRIASMVFSVPAVKGIEFGAGFSAARMKGSEHNDPFIIESDSGRIKTKTNNHGGILGGISTGMPILFKAAVKPTPSISIEQKTVNLKNLAEETLSVKGRHDPCIVMRAVPCIEAATACAVLDLLMEARGKNQWK